MSNFVVAGSLFGPQNTTAVKFHDIYKCIVTDMEGTTSEVRQTSIKLITGKLYIYDIIAYSNCFYLDIAIQVLFNKTVFGSIRNISILTTNESGRCFDLICTLVF